jgi:hypothetical protein
MEDCERESYYQQKLMYVLQQLTVVLSQFRKEGARENKGA